MTENETSPFENAWKSLEKTSVSSRVVQRPLWWAKESFLAYGVKTQVSSIRALSNSQLYRSAAAVWQSCLLSLRGPHLLTHPPLSVVLAAFRSYSEHPPLWASNESLSSSGEVTGLERKSQKGKTRTTLKYRSRNAFSPSPCYKNW